MVSVKKRKVFILENDALIFLAFQNIFFENYELQSLDEQINSKDLTEKMSDEGFLFVNIFFLNEHVSSLISANPRIKDRILFYALGSQNVDCLKDKMEFLISINANAIALEATPTQLKYAVLCMEQKIQFFCPQFTNHLLNRKADEKNIKNSLLSAREIQVLQAISQGLSSRQAAEKLEITVRTVEAHRWRIMKKLKAHNVAQLIQEANRLKLIT